MVSSQRLISAGLLLVNVGLVLTGPGMFSLDHAIFGRRRSRAPAAREAA